MNYQTIRRISPRVGLLLLAAMAAVLGDCRCPADPGSIDVTPDCPEVQAASGIQLQANLASIRPLGSTIQLRVRGNRDAAADLCFQRGAQVSLLQTLEGTGNVNQTMPNLAHGAWEIRVTVLSGGGHQPVVLTKNLVPGSTHTLAITGNAAGDLTANFLD